MSSEFSAEPRELNAASAAAFAADIMPELMAELHVPGAALVIVNREEIVYAGGFGSADLASGRPVDPAETLFRAGSVSKLFTATAVMQLVEQGQIALDDDINIHLRRLQVAEQFNRPITVADLLLHTAGFDEVFMGMHSELSAEVQPLDQFLAEHLPARHIPPGEIVNYSDYGYTLAGLLIEDVTGQPFDQYMAEHLFTPLQMEHATFAQPLPEAWRGRLAIGYGYDGRDYQPYPLDIVNVVPAAGLVATPENIAHFMMAHLNDGVYREQAILQGETVAAMQQRQVAHHPEVRGRGYGFSELLDNGRRMVFHDGSNPGFLNRLVLLPEEGIGFYLTYNGDQFAPATRFRRDFTDQWLDAFFPEVESAAAPPLNPLPAAGIAPQWAGYYREVTPYSADTLQRIDSLLNQARVEATADGLAMFGRAYVPVEETVFKSLDGESTVVFREGTADAPTYLFIGSGALARVPWFDAQPVVLGLVGWFFALFLGMVIGGFLLREAGSVVRGLLVGIGLLNLLFVVGLAVALQQMDLWQFFFGIPLQIIALLVIPLVTIGLSLVLLVLVARGMVNTPPGWRQQFYWGLVMITLLVFPLFLARWNLLGFRF